MKRGGQVIYSGPLGRNSHKVVEYFEVINYLIIIFMQLNHNLAPFACMNLIHDLSAKLLI